MDSLTLHDQANEAQIARACELVAALRLESQEEAQRCRDDLEAFGNDAVAILEQILAQSEAVAGNELQAERSALEQDRAEWDRVRQRVEADLARREEELGVVPELQKKFDLALADLQKLREHVAKLEEELAARPEADASESAELVQLRAERDALLTQLDQIASQPAMPDDSQEMADLRDRFEMAVEDVRQLKQEKQELTEQLHRSVVEEPAVAASSWEAQKQLLLAQLEEEGESEDEKRQAERAQIAGTIQITDGVVQEKDKQIAQLEGQLAEMAPSLADVNPHDAALASILDEDETIRAERERLARLEEELQEKLRAAELELSVERAKFARAQSELSEQQLELETLREEQQGVVVQPGQSKGRQRWLQQLGLSDESS